MPGVSTGSFELTVTFVLLLLMAFFGIGPAIRALYPGQAAMVDKAAPAAGVIGIVGFLWGLWMVIQVLLAIGSGFLYWLVMLIGALDLVALGFLLGYGLVAKQMQGKNEQLLERGKRVQQTIGGFQFPLGLIALFCAGFVFSFRAFVGFAAAILTGS